MSEPYPADASDTSGPSRQLGPATGDRGSVDSSEAGSPGSACTHPPASGDCCEDMSSRSRTGVKPKARVPGWKARRGATAQFQERVHSGPQQAAIELDEGRAIGIAAVVDLGPGI